MHAKRQPLPIVFRAYRADGAVIALLPTCPGTNDPATVTTYMHVGQHSPGCTCPTGTRPATAREYRPLLRELRRIGYRGLVVVRRCTAAHYRERERELARQYAAHIRSTPTA